MWDWKSSDSVENRGNQLIKPDKFLIYGLDRDAVRQVLAQAPMEFSASARLKEVVLEIPTPDGNLERFRVEESALLSPELATQYPDWKYYQGYGIDDPTATARIDITMNGFHAYVLSSKGTYSIDPFQQNDLGNYLVYAKKDLPNHFPMHCEFGTSGEAETKPAAKPELDAPAFSIGAQMRTYRLAMATTGEYTTVFRQAGDTDAQAQARGLAAVTVTVNRVAGVYRRDLAIDFTLVSGVNLVYPNATTDPWVNTSSDLNNITTNINNVIGAAAYDIGHLVQTSDGGVAGLGVVCGASKGRGLTGRPNPFGDSFDIDYVAHEMGHQFNQNHTFNSPSNCGSSPAASRVEAGSGITIMGYAGICSSTSNLAQNSIDVFHVYNLTETVNFVATGAGGTCGTAAGTNAVPVIGAMTASYSIPFNTPFALTATATDADSNPLTYNWEMNNAGATASVYPSSPDDDDTTLAARPILRSYVPSSNSTRMFPSLTYILNNGNEAPVTFTGTSATGTVCGTVGTCITGEDLPSIARTMEFRVTVRDGRGGNVDAPVSVTSVNTTTPFKVTVGNTAGTTFTGGASRTITWDVSGTTAAPISTANVKISLSTDGGQTFPTVLAASTANDGSESVAIPNTPTTQARIKIEAVGNIFFDINDANITIGASGGPAQINGGQIGIVSESCGVGNGTPDPGETLTISLPLSNTGGTNTTNLTATLQASGGVTSAVSQSYGVVAAGGSAVTRNFTFTVSSAIACGSPVTLTFVVADGATTFPNITQTYSTGTPSVSLTENFDGVTAPALPSGWTNVQTSGTGISWVTSTTTPSSAPNAAYAVEVATVNAAALVSPAVTVGSANAQLKFKNRYNLESTFDGTVLEYSINGGTTWTDIVTGGGTFVSGGYTGPISTAWQSPISGRQAWSGASANYVDTVVNLPASLNGQSVRFRWLTASDSSEIATGTPGHWVDDVQVLGGVTCACSGPQACFIQRKSDFNGDGLTDYGVFRPSNGVWYVQPNGAGSAYGAAFGASGDKLQPADYDGDGRTDFGVFRGGAWYWINSSTNTVGYANWGTASDIPVAGDYVGTGTGGNRAEVSVYRPSTGVWYAMNLADNTMAAIQWGGAASDVPVLGDFDNDCKLDFAVRRTTNDPAPGATQFFVRLSNGGTASARWGREDMAMAIADYDGDGRSDIGVVDNLGGLLRWYVISTTTTVLFNGTQFGQSGDIVTVGTYDADTKADLSIWRPSVGTFAYRSTVSGTEIQRIFGAATDIPTARASQYPLP